MRIGFYDEVIQTGTNFLTITSEAGFSIPSQDYRLYIDRKKFNHVGATFDIAFSAKTEVSTIILENVLASHIVASNLSYNTGTTSTALDIQYASNTQTSYIFDLGFSETTLTFDSVTALLDGESWMISSDGEFNGSYTISALGETAGSFQSFLDNIYFLRKIFYLDSLPDSEGLLISYNKMNIIHNIADGGIKKSSLSEASVVTIEIDFIKEDERDSLKSLYEKFNSFFIVIDEENADIAPEYEGQALKVNWVGDFEFKQLSDDYKGNGYRGVINLAEVPK